ncbi:MAG TPA: tetratricopeptide repeat protein [Candidatus Polarisedimenticolaceae bacterium]|nr:tetratricopeptide repeat protein [Candidatus Polarisedimenticolaceae bacterium]
MTRRACRATLAAMAAAGLLARLGYVLAQRAHDPGFARPILDGAVYVDQAAKILAGRPWPPGAFYLAPLYPFVVAGVFRTIGPSFAGLYLLQHAAIVAAALALAAVARRHAGESAGLASGALVLLYHPLLFFASRPLGESVALLALAGSLLLASRGDRGAFGAGVAAGLASLARPNLLLVPAVWGAREAQLRRWRRVIALAGGTALVVLPVTLRNVVVSGHLVAVSSNGGITLYHGNGPGASGIYTPPDGFSGDVALQQDEATSLARARSGRALDAVEADRWWGRQAWGARLADPTGTARLAAKRGLLLLDDYEHALDEAPESDDNPWRLTAPVGFGWLLGLAAAGVALVGFRGTGGGIVWGALAATAVAPLAFYVSSRYRLPLALVLTVPAGIGAATLARGDLDLRKRLGAGAIGAAFLALSLLIPSARLARLEEATTAANRASLLRWAGDLPRAEAEARRALALDASSVAARYNLGVILEAEGREVDAEAAYREVLSIDPGSAEAAGNLGKMLILRGEASAAIPILEGAVARRPGHEACWTNLVLALVVLKRFPEAAERADAALRAGVRLDPEVVAAAHGGGAP